jgi:putative glycosyltransferase (exosortase G-associated)
MTALRSLVLFWGVWLLVPAIVDGLTTLASLGGVLLLRRRRTRPLTYYPFISIVIPVYHRSLATLEACLRSIAAQDYPRNRMEVLLINNDNSHATFAVFVRLHTTLGLNLFWHAILNQGKSWALNAGIHLSKGQYIFNIDSDTVLAPDAIRRVVEVMEADRQLGAVTGAIEVLPPAPRAAPITRLLGECEFFEYLTAFQVGRTYQTLLQNLYTLSGAFSVFRRDVLLKTFLYNQETVTEDTDLTFALYERMRGQRIGCVADAIAYVHPIESLRALYAQRVRWQRGQVEVSARYRSLMGRSIFRLRGFAPARTLLIDHTLAFPRLVWTFLLPILVLFGYPLALIVSAIVVLYLFYVLIDLAWAGVAWLHARPPTRKRLRRIWWLLPVLPLYRMLIFWFRFSGFLYAVAEPGAWSVQDPLTQARRGITELRRSVARIAHIH